MKTLKIRGEYYHQKLKLFRDAPEFSELFLYIKVHTCVKFVGTFCVLSFFLKLFQFFFPMCIRSFI